MKQKNKHTLSLFLSAALAVLLAGCRTGINETAPKNAAKGTASGGVFNAEWILRQQEETGNKEAVRKGYSIVKTLDSFAPESFTALGGSVESVLNLHDGALYFLVKTDNDDRRFRSAVRNLDGVFYAQPDYRYAAPAAIEDGNAQPPYRKRKTAVSPFQTEDGNLKDDPKADLADWGLTVIHALEAFQRYDSHDAIHPALAAIIDTGVNGFQEDFYDKQGNSIILYAKASIAYNASSPLSSLQPIPIIENWDNHGHGTHCSGTIAAVGNNGKGICGVSHANTKLITYRGMGAAGGETHATYSCLGDLAAIVTELRKAPEERNAAVFTGLPPEVMASPKLVQATVPVNLSFGGLEAAPFEVEMMNKALAAGILPIAAMGNDGKTIANYPAALQGVLAVGATSMDDTRPVFSSGGSWMSVCAPGEAIYSCSNGGSHWADPVFPDRKNAYRWMSGTSMATPFITGTVAYLLSLNPNLTPYQIKTVLENTADKIDTGSPYGQYDARGFSKWYGYGRVNVLKAAQQIISGSAPPEGIRYSEKAVIVTVKKAGIAQLKKPVWLYEKQSGVCAAVGMTDENSGTVSFYGLRTDIEYEIGVNDAGVYQTCSVTVPAASDMKYTFDF